MTAIRQEGNKAVGQFGNSVLWQYGIMAIRHYGNAALGQYGIRARETIYYSSPVTRYPSLVTPSLHHFVTPP
jgi:hypothetical protein